MMEKRVGKLEAIYGQHLEETIIFITSFSEGIASTLPKPEQEIARQRFEGKKLIVIRVPLGYKPCGGN